MKRILIFSCLIILFSGCHHIPQGTEDLLSHTHSDRWPERLLCPRPSSWQISGKGSVQHVQEAHSFQYNWQQHDISHFKIVLSGPMGAQRTELKSDENGVILNLSDGQELIQETSDSFLDDLFGIDVKMLQLTSWLFGMPDLSMPYLASVDQYGRPHHLTQDGWSIDYRYQDLQPSVCQSPYRIDIANQLTKLRLVIK